MNLRTLAILVALLGLAVMLFADPRTGASDLKTSAGAASVNESLSDLQNQIRTHRHDGTDNSSLLSSPYISTGTLIMQSPNGACWSCGPDNAGTWACASTTCP